LIDVLIVGGGPAGNQTALSLARRGFSVTVVDYRTELGEKLCTGIVGRECADRYQIPANLIHHRARGATVISPTGRAVLIEREEDQAFIIDRVRFVASIAHRAQAASATYALGRRVASISVDDSGAILTAHHGGAVEEFRARAVVVAAGFGSPLARSLGLRPASPSAFAAQVALRGVDVDSVQVLAHRHMPQGFFGWMVPTLPGRALAGVIGRGRPRTALATMLEGLKAEGAAFEAEGPAQAWGVPIRPTPCSYGTRSLLVGDVAGQVKPTTGGGIYYALRCAEIAAEVLGDALESGDLSSQALKPYEERWKSMLGRELRLGYIARRIYEQLGARELDSLLLLTASNGLLKEGVKFDWHADLVSRALGYRLFENILGPFTRLGRRVDVGADD
jgi:geranylgeranyl reductase family protein